MKWLRRKIERFKYNRDMERTGQIWFILRKYYYPSLRKDFMIQTMLAMDFTNEELEELSKLFGREAHDRERLRQYGRK